MVSISSSSLLHFFNARSLSCWTWTDCVCSQRWVIKKCNWNCVQNLQSKDWRISTLYTNRIKTSTVTLSHRIPKWLRLNLGKRRGLIKGSRWSGCNLATGSANNWGLTWTKEGDWSKAVANLAAVCPQEAQTTGKGSGLISIRLCHLQSGWGCSQVYWYQASHCALYSQAGAVIRYIDIKHQIEHFCTLYLNGLEPLFIH